MHGAGQRRGGTLGSQACSMGLGRVQRGESRERPQDEGRKRGRRLDSGLGGRRSWQETLTPGRGARWEGGL